MTFTVAAFQGPMMLKQPLAVVEKICTLLEVADQEQIVNVTSK